MLVYFMVIGNIYGNLAYICFHLVYFVAFWSTVPVWVCFTKKNLARANYYVGYY
jgi:hypothetical protein